MREYFEMTYPEFSGCYALLSEGRVVYVGKSTNVLVRLSNHRNRLRRIERGKSVAAWRETCMVYQFDTVRIYPCRAAELDALERELVMLYNPMYNVQTPQAKPVDISALARRANIDISQWKQHEISTMRYSPRPLPKSGYRRVA